MPPSRDQPTRLELAASSVKPSAKSRRGLKPSSVRALLMSAKQWRMSPVRALPRISGFKSSRPIAAAKVSAMRRIERSSPLPMLIVSNSE